MKKLLVLIFVGLFFCACTPFEIADNKRILIRGRITTSSEDALGNIPIAMGTATSSGFSISPSPSTEILQEYNTLADGSFSFVSFDIKDDPFLILVNHPKLVEQEDYQHITYYDERGGRAAYLIDFGNIELKKRVPLEVVFNNTSGTEETVSFSVEFHSPDIFVPVDDWSNLPTPELLQEYVEVLYYDQSFTEEGIYSRTIEVLEGTEAKIIYSLGETNETEIMIPIFDEPLTHEISY